MNETMTKTECRIALDAMKEQMRKLTDSYAKAIEQQMGKNDFTWVKQHAEDINSKVVALAIVMKKIATQMYEAKE